MILGQGAFGRVMKAEAIGIGDSQNVISVAVKMVKGIYRSFMGGLIFMCVYSLTNRGK
jgi:hypothetical protein